MASYRRAAAALTNFLRETRRLDLGRVDWLLILYPLMIAMLVKITTYNFTIT